MGKLQKELDEAESIVVNLMNNENLQSWYRSYLPQEIRINYNPVDHLTLYQKLEDLYKKEKETSSLIEKIRIWGEEAKIQRELEPYQNAFFNSGLKKEPYSSQPHYLANVTRSHKSKPNNTKNYKSKLSKAAAIACVGLLALGGALGIVAAEDMHHSFDKTYKEISNLGIPDLPSGDPTKLKVDVDVKVELFKKYWDWSKMGWGWKFVNSSHKQVRFYIPYEEISLTLLYEKYRELNIEELSPSEKNDIFNAYSEALYAFIARSINENPENIKGKDMSFIVEKYMQNQLKDLVPDPKDIVTSLVIDKLTRGTYSTAKGGISAINKMAYTMYNINTLLDDLESASRKVAQNPNMEKKTMDNIRALSEKGDINFDTHMWDYGCDVIRTANLQFDDMAKEIYPGPYLDNDEIRGRVYYAYHILGKEVKDHREYPSAFFSPTSGAPSPFFSYHILNIYGKKYGIDLPPHLTESKPVIPINQSQKDNLIKVSDLANKFHLSKYVGKEIKPKTRFGESFYIVDNKIRDDYRKYQDKLEDLVKWYRNIIVEKDKVILPEKPTSLNSLNITPEKFEEYTNYLVDRIEDGRDLYKIDELKKEVEKSYGPLTKNILIFNTPYLTQKSELTKLEKLIDSNSIDNKEAEKRLSQIKADIKNTENNLFYSNIHKIESFIEPLI